MGHVVVVLEIYQYSRESIVNIAWNENGPVRGNDALKLLGKTASRMEKGVLGSVAFYDDITITHNDFDYMEKHYENYFKPELALPE